MRNCALIPETSVHVAITSCFRPIKLTVVLILKFLEMQGKDYLGSASGSEFV